MAFRAVQSLALIVAAAVSVAVLTPASAQYDREGRYVPSPMGVPADPYARPVPMYPGTPGGAAGEPILPRGSMPAPAAPSHIPPRTYTEPMRPTFVPLTLAQCGEGWSRKLLVPPTEFRRRCASMRRYQEELERQGKDKGRDEVRKSAPLDRE